MARTYDLTDPAQKQAYWEDTSLRWLLHGELFVRYNDPPGSITVLDRDEATLADTAVADVVTP